MDSWLGLPEWKDTCENRGIVLRKRLKKQWPDVRLLSHERGRFAIETSVKSLWSEKPA